MRFRNKVRTVLQRVPLAFHSIREVRDILRLDSLSPANTADGFLFVGSGAMQRQDFAPHERQIFSDLLKSHDIFCDIGANVGYFSCLARHMGKRVLSFEPIRSNLHYLYKNIELNQWHDGIEVYPIAAGDRAGLAPVFGARCGSSLTESWSGGSKTHEVVSVLPLDSVLQQRFLSEKIFCKLDVEGFEFQVLQGAKELLSRAVAPTWWVEIFLDRGHASGLNKNFAATFKLLFQSGYACYANGKGDSPITLSLVEQWQHEQKGPAYSNYLFTK